MSERASYQQRVTVLRRNRWRLLAMAWPLFFSAMGLLMLLVGATSRATFLLTGLFLAMATLSKAWDDNIDPRREPCLLTIDAGRLTLGGESHDVDAIRTGYQLAGDPPVIRLFFGKARLPVDLELETRKETEAVLEALDLSPRQRVATFRTFASPHGWRGALLTFVPIALFVVTYVQLGVVGFWLIPLLLLWAFATRQWRRKVHVGSDGLRVERGLLFDRFVPHEAIVGVSVVPTAQEGEFHVLVRTANERPCCRACEASSTRATNALASRSVRNPTR
jgi:hypothetical protein